MIIVGHVKVGVELAREHNLPTSIIPFIQQHHGTTLVEYFYYQACKRETKETGEEAQVSEYEYRYPGPRPRSREVAVVMLADAVESACRAMQEPTAARVETLVHELAMKRLLDGQFGECDLTIKDLETMERSMVKSVLSIYHGRIAYPSMANITAVPLIAAGPGRRRRKRHNSWCVLDPELEVGFEFPVSGCVVKHPSFHLSLPHSPAGGSRRILRKHLPCAAQTAALAVAGIVGRARRRSPDGPSLHDNSSELPAPPMCLPFHWIATAREM